MAVHVQFIPQLVHILGVIEMRCRIGVPCKLHLTVCTREIHICSKQKSVLCVWASILPVQRHVVCVPKLLYHCIICYTEVCQRLDEEMYQA